MCTGRPFSALSDNKLNSFFAIVELGYDCASMPRLVATSRALYGRLMPFHRGDFHHSSMVAISDCKIDSSSSGVGATCRGLFEVEDMRVVMRKAD